MTINELIAQGEHVQQDFKLRVDDSRKIARTLTAFANTKGGRLLIGVKDNGKIAGCDPTEEFHIIDAAAEMHCKPAVPFTTEVWQEGHKLVLQINVEPSENRPHRSPDEDGRWLTYVRVADNTLVANKILVRVWKKLKNLDSMPEEMSEPQLNLLRLIESRGNSTLSGLYRNSDLSKREIDDLLVLFICWKLVKQEITPEGTFYSTC